jgi:hypothetical protein
MAQADKVEGMSPTSVSAPTTAPPDTTSISRSLVVGSAVESVRLPNVADGCRQRADQRPIYVRLRKNSSRALLHWVVALVVYQLVFAALALANIPAPFPGIGRSSVFALLAFLLVITPVAYFLGAFDE